MSGAAIGRPKRGRPAKAPDDNDMLKAGTLPHDLKADCVPMTSGTAPAASTPALAPAAPAEASAPAAAPVLDLEGAKRIADELPERAKADPGAPFLPEVLDALALIEEPDWQRLRPRLKASKVRMKDLDAARERRIEARRSAAAAKVPAPAAPVPVEIVRNVVEDGPLGPTAIGWYALTDEDGAPAWVAHHRSEARMLVAGSGTPGEAQRAMARAVAAPWRIVCRPFEPEYPQAGKRVWNRNAAQLRFKPRPGEHPTWDMIMRHCGAGLDEAIAVDPWCVANNVRDGGDYLRLWAAALIQEPRSPLPYLFFYGRQGSGKTIFHLVLGRLLTRGYVSANSALKSEQGFNGELAGAVLCSVEEINLRTEKTALPRVKDWSTNPDLAIHDKGRTQFTVPNTTHWVQCANRPDFCPIFEGDTRVTMINVLHAEKEIPRDELMRRAESEAPAFLHTIRTLTIPATPTRLRIPVITTEDKREQERAGRTDLELYLDRHPHWLALDASEIFDRLKGESGVQADKWPVPRIAQDMTDYAAKNGLTEDVRLARAIRNWFEAGSRRPRSGTATKLLAEMASVATWPPAKAGIRMKSIAGSLLEAKIVFVRPEDRGEPRSSEGARWIFEPVTSPPNVRALDGRGAAS